MRICMLAYSIYEWDHRIIRYAKTLANRGDHVDVIALRRKGQDSSGLLNGVHVFRIQKRDFTERRQTSYLVRILLFFFRGMWLVTCNHLRSRYDVIHVHSVPDFLVFSAWLPRLTGSKVILDIHDLLPEFYASKFKRGLGSLPCKILRIEERLSIAFSDYVIISNHLWQRKLLARSAKKQKCGVVLNLPDRSVFHPRERTRTDDKFIVFFPGSLNRHQGVDIAIRAFALMKKKVPNAEFHIFGEGPEREGLIALASELGLAGSVLIRECVPVAEVAKRMENSDLGVVPKRNDSFGNEAFSTKVLEFMSMRVPVIVADTDIDHFYFNEEVVMFFRSGDAE